MGDPKVFKADELIRLYFSEDSRHLRVAAQVFKIKNA